MSTEASAASGHAPLSLNASDEKAFGFWIYLMTDAIIFALLFATYVVLSGTEIIAKIDCPILLLTAKPMMGMDVSAGLAIFADNWKDGQHIQFDDSGHAIHFEQFEQFIEVVRPFFDVH
jgi:heme/copper-type cytochrome/quinol oxidase subunit 3